MPLIIADGIYNHNANNSLQIVSDSSCQVTGRAMIGGPLHANYFHLPRTLTVNNETINTVDFGYSNITVKRCLSNESISCTEFSLAGQQITTTGFVYAFVAGDIIHVSGSRSNDGLYEVASIAASDIVIATTPTCTLCKDTLGADEIIGAGYSASINIVNPAFLSWYNTGSAWYFGYIDASKVQQSYLAIGIHAGSAAVDFATSHPNISAYGTSVAGSGASKVGLYSTGMAIITTTDVQSAIGELDTAFGAAGVPVIPSIALGEVANTGTTVNYIAADSTIQAFHDSAVEDIAAGDVASKGTMAYAARHDHVHGFPVAAPVEVSGSNAEGVATTMSRSDHQHQLDVVDGPVVKSGIVALAAGETSKSVVFATPFAASISCCGAIVIADAGDDGILCDVTAYSVNGMTVRFSTAIYGLNYSLSYSAMGA
jgi:hypothetical protein